MSRADHRSQTLGAPCGRLARLLGPSFAIGLLGAALLAAPAQGQTTCPLPSNEELQVLDLINQQRVANNLAPVELDGRLMESAVRHSEDMRDGCFLSHTGSDGSSKNQRMLDAGYPDPGQEAVGAGQISPSQIVSAWMASTPHRGILLNANARHVGIGHAVGPDLCVLDPYGVAVMPHFWTADFGTANEPAQPACDAPDNAPPIATILSPSSGASVSGAVSVSVAAIDDVAVASVALWIDGTLHSTDTTAPYSFSWNTAAAPDGLHTLEAVAVDMKGAMGSSGYVVVDVSNQAPPSDLAPPSVAITSPADGSSVSRTVQIGVQASDDVALDRIEVRLDGAALGTVACSGVSCSGSVSWNARKAATGSHSVSAQAWDRAGRVSSVVSISVTKSGGSKRRGGGKKGRGKR